MNKATKTNKTNKTNREEIRGKIIRIAIFIASMVAIIALVAAIIELSAPQEYRDALASLQRINKEACSTIRTNDKTEHFGRSKIEECFNRTNYSKEAKEYAWKKANIDFDAKAIKLVEEMIDTLSNTLSRGKGMDYESARKAVIKATLMEQDELKKELAESWGYTQEQIDNAFKKVLVL